MLPQRLRMHCSPPGQSAVRAKRPDLPPLGGKVSISGPSRPAAPVASHDILARQLRDLDQHDIRRHSP
jgi:hypothetical protein